MSFSSSSSSTTWLNAAFTSLSLTTTHSSSSSSSCKTTPPLHHHHHHPNLSFNPDTVLLHGLTSVPSTHVLHHLNRWAKLVWRAAVDACALAEFRRVASLDTLIALGATAVSLLHATCTSMKQCHVLQWIPVIGIMLFADDPNALHGLTSHHNSNSNNHVDHVDVRDDDDNDDNNAVVHVQVVDGHDSLATTTVTNLVHLDEIIQIDAVCAFLFTHHSHPLDSAMSHFASLSSPSHSHSHSSSSSSVSTPATTSIIKDTIINNNNHNSTNNNITNKSPPTSSHVDNNHDDDIRAQLNTLHAKVSDLTLSVRRNEQMTNELLTSFQLWSTFLLDEMRQYNNNNSGMSQLQQQQRNDERLCQFNNAMTGMSRQVVNLNRADNNGLSNITQSLHDMIGHHHPHPLLHPHHSIDMVITPKGNNHKQPTTPTPPLQPRSSSRSVEPPQVNNHHRAPSSTGSSSTSSDFPSPHILPSTAVRQHHSYPYASGHHPQPKPHPQPHLARQGSAGNAKKGRRIFRDGRWITQ